MWPVIHILKEVHAQSVLNRIYLILVYIGSFLIFFSLEYFSGNQIRIEHSVIAITFLGLAILHWLSSFLSTKEGQVRLTARGLSLNTVVPVVIILMLLFRIMGTEQQPAVGYSEITSAYAIKGMFMSIVSISLPGIILLSIVSPNLRLLLRLVFGVHLSIAIIGVMTFVLYYFQVNTNLMFSLTLFLLAGMWLTKLVLSGTIGKKSIFNPSFLGRPITTYPQIVINKWTITFALIMASSIAVGFLFHTTQVYMMPGDAWRALQSGVNLIAGRNVETTLADLEYPLGYGFIMAGVSEIAGVPIVNTNMFLFPLVSLNILSVYTLARYVFHAGQGVATSTSFFYAFMGGFGWLMAQIHNLGSGFWEISYVTQDILFSNYFLNSIQFWHRSASLTFGFAAIIMFYLAMTKSGKERWFFLSTSSLFLIFAFFIHMLPIIFILPIILYIWYAEGRKSLSTLTIFAITALVMFTAFDLLLHGYYSSLTLLKIDKVLVPSLNLDAFPPEFVIAGISFVIAIGIAIPYVVSRYNTRLRNRSSASMNSEQVQIPTTSNTSHVQFSVPLLLPVSIVLLGLYFYGIFIWSTFPQVFGILYQMNQLPWYYLPIRFGIVGLLSIGTLFFVRKKDKWIGPVSVWVISLLVVGNVWWGSKILGFLFPVLAFLAAYSLHSTKDWFAQFFHQHVSSRLIMKVTKISAAIGLGVIIVVSTSSYIYGMSHYVNENTEMYTSAIKVTSWIYANVPADETVGIYSKDYAVQVGVSNLSAHDAVIFEDVNELTDSGLKYFVGSKNQLPLEIRDDFVTIYESGSFSISILEEKLSGAAS